MDSLTWHLPKTPDVLKQLPSLQQPADLKNMRAMALTNAIVMYSTMPVAHIGGSGYHMPVAHVTSPDNKMVKQVIVVNPLAEPVKP